ncbi:flagellar biosynthesis protein [Clostridium tetani]|uniref:Putative flagellar hook associated protein n=1 Tax=Clostridium tetani (strain Massachusetts / E88) TaxID=212717 RepID=Q893Y7_CLOTE|nr:TIGR02530 family flagellar biosynthesis protein [Clostridium tetani]AAO36205.1 putative flagellar hook associated protein [Clostridium tetani E88]AVP54202.1 flagellar biosynthesis protein [Clostridium tetani]KGI37834.1 flagellar biosynthesis protein [Clostridium tetani]KGI45444.1 flagellar biosynthesis protein [Clostridium tetani]KHO31745.1 flagellar biosynthesis protein [Clostridium tetani]
MGYRVINGKIHFIEGFKGYANTQSNKSTESLKKTSFDDVLKKEINKEDTFVLSNHAHERLRERNIVLNQQDMKKVNEGINMGEKKGCKEIVILYKDIALVTNIKNRTVITAMAKDESKGNVFTNIDGMVIL